MDSHDKADDPAPGASDATESSILTDLEEVAEDAAEIGRRLTSLAGATSRDGPKAEARRMLGQLGDASRLLAATAAPGSDASKLMDVIEEGGEAVADLLEAAEGAVAACQLIEAAIADEPATEASGAQQALEADDVDAGEAGELQAIRTSFQLNSREAALQVASFTLAEELSKPYRCVIEATAETEPPGIESFVGEVATLTLDRGARQRAVTGVLTSVAWEVSQDGRTRATLVLEPAMKVMAVGRRSRVFQDRTTVEIVKEVVEEGLSPFQRALQVRAEHSAAKREYCVQYLESDLAFVTRLLAEEGLSYFFVQEEDAETMVISGQNEEFEDLDTLPLLSRDDLEADREGISILRFRSQLQPESCRVSDHDWTGAAPVQTQLTHESSENRSESEASVSTSLLWHEHDGPLLFSEFDETEDRYLASNLPEVATLSLQRARVDARVVSGEGDVLTMAPGRRFSVAGREYAVTQVIHEGVSEATGPGYTNRFVAVPVDVRCVPSLDQTSVPRVHGCLIATVVGSSEPLAAPSTVTSDSEQGEEIYTDRFGRVRVRFHWNGSPTSNDLEAHSSCWLRVGQNWAGNGFGSLFVPRVGMEVLVQFEGGRLDRPLCTGCVYSGRNVPPLDLPKELTQTVLRTESSPGGDGYNEIRFDDAAGAESIKVHAQREYALRVNQNDSTSIGGSQTVQVEGDQTVEVTGEQRRIVSGRVTETLESGGALDVTAGDWVQTVAAGAWSVAAATEAEFTASQSETLRLAADGVQARSASRVSLAVENARAAVASDSIALSLGSSSLVVEAGAIELSVGGSRMRLDGDGVWIRGAAIDVSSGSSRLELQDGAARLSNGGGAKIQLTGPNVQLNS